MKGQADAGVPRSASHGGDPASIGGIALDVRTGTCTWSDAVFRIHGFEPGDVVPTTELMRAHVHPDDLERVLAAVRHTTLTAPTGGSGLVYYRLVDARQRVHQIVAIGRVARSDDGELIGLTGHLVDVTEANRALSEDEIRRSIEDFTEHRAVIEQAKGVLVQLLAVDAEEAFRVLKELSQHTNVRVRDLADRLVDAAAHEKTPSSLDVGDPVLDTLTEMFS
jgi:hypothetical protein